MYELMYKNEVEYRNLEKSLRINFVYSYKNYYFNITHL
jgi:hypothetical protein